MATEIVTVAVPRIPRIHDPAPDFEATSTHGIIRLSDYTSKGKWVLLFSHPADFTPVCTTEFVEFARHYPEFDLGWKRFRFLARSRVLILRF